MEGISLRHWLLPHLSRESHSLLCILTGWREYHSDTGCCLTSVENLTPSCVSSLDGLNINQTLAAASPQETIPLPPVYPHCGREYHSDTGCCLTSGENTTLSCLSSLMAGNITQTLAAVSPQERIPLPPVYRHLGEGISLRHWLLSHLRRQYHSLLSIVTRGIEYHSDTGCCLTSGENTTPSCLSSLGGGNITQTLAAVSPQERIPLPPVYRHSGEGISLRHWLLPHLRRQYHSLLPILTQGREHHSDTGCCLTSGDNTTRSYLSSHGGGNITQTLAAASPQERIRPPPVYPHCGREYHSDTGCCLTSGDNTTPSYLSSHGGGNITQTLAAASPQERIRLPPVYPHCGREYHSDTGCCLTSGENTTPSCLSSLGGGNITQTLAAVSPQETIPLPPVYRHLGERISLRHWLLSHLRREYHSFLSIVTWGREYHSDTGCCLTSGDNTTPSCLSSLGGGNITQTLAAASPQETIPLPPVYPHSGQGTSLRHWLLPHLRREYHALLPILTQGTEHHSDTGCCLTSGENTTLSYLSSHGGGNITQTLAAASPQERIRLPPVYPHCGREYHSDTGCCLTSGENTTPSCLSSLWQGISLKHWLLSHLRREYHSLLPIITQGREYHSDTERIPLTPVHPHCGIEYHSDTGCCLTSGENTTPSCLSSLGGGNITQTLAAVSPQETIPLPPVYRHLGEGISLRHWLLSHLRREYDSLLSILTVAGNITQTLAAVSPQERIPLPPVYRHLGEGISLRHWLLSHLRRQYHSLLSIVTWGREYHSDTGSCLTSGENTTPSCLSSLGGGNITQTLAASSPQETIPLPPVYRHLGEGISLRHWLLPHLRRQYHSLLSILTQGREHHSDTGCCLTSGENTTPSCLSSLRAGNIIQTLAAASPQERIPLPPIYHHTGEGISLRHWLLPHLKREYDSLLSILTVAGNITQTLAAVSPQERITLPPAYPHCGREYHSNTGCCLTSGENTTLSCLSSLRAGNITQTLREYHSLLSILTVAGNITQTLAAASPQGKIPLPPVYRHSGEGISLRHWLLPHLRRQHHALLSILTQGREYHSDTCCCLISGENTTLS